MSKNNKNKKRNYSQKKLHTFKFPTKLKKAIDEMIDELNWGEYKESCQKSGLTNSELIPIVGKDIVQGVEIIMENNHNAIVDYLIEDYAYQNLPKIETVFHKYIDDCEDKIVRYITNKLTEKINKEVFNEDFIEIIRIRKSA